jgi:hypothetical protein
VKSRWSSERKEYRFSTRTARLAGSAVVPVRATGCMRNLASYMTGWGSRSGKRTPLMQNCPWPVLCQSP